MSFEILEYPFKCWILDIIDDEKIKSDIFDLLGEADLSLRYPSIMLYDIDNLIEDKSISQNEHVLIVKLEKIDRFDNQYCLDLKNFSGCRKVAEQVIGILNDSNAVLKMIIKSIDVKWRTMFDLDKLCVTLMNGMKLKLSYDGNDIKIQEKTNLLYNYGFQCKIEYKNNEGDKEENGSGCEENGSGCEDDEIEDLKKILSELAVKKVKTN